MGMSIPLSGGDSPNGQPRGFTISLRSSGTPATPTDRETSILRAVAAAAAIKGAQPARALAKKAKEDPGHGDLTFDQAQKDALKPVVAAVDRAMTNRAKAAVAESRHTAVARAIGADPVLVRAAEDAISAVPLNAGVNPALVAARRWVANTDVRLLEQVADAAAREDGVGIVGDASTRLDQVDAAVAGIDQKIQAAIQPAPLAAALPAAIAAVPPAQLGGALAAAIGALPPAQLAAVLPAAIAAVPAAQLAVELNPTLTAALQPLAQRVAALEAKVP